MLIIVIGFHEDTGEAIGGDVFLAKDDRVAVACAIEWATYSYPVGSWCAYQYLPSWGPGREIKPIDSDYK